jgi:hypothetical protein
LSIASALHRAHDLGSRLAIWIRNTTLREAVVRLILSTSPVLDVVAVALFAFHDAVDGARRVVLAVILRAMSHLSLLTLALELVDITAGVAVSPILVEVGTEVTVPRAIH